MHSTWLVFELAGALASFGGVAPGQVRDTDVVPTRSALLGLLAAAMGITREESERQKQLGTDLAFACRVQHESATLMRDYHTAQAPPEPALKGRPRRTRKDELSVPKDDLNTVLSDRYYYSDFAATIAINGPAKTLVTLSAALKQPKFTLFLGRKSCPLGWPLYPVQIQSESLVDAFAQFDAAHAEKLKLGGLKPSSYPNQAQLYAADEALKDQLKSISANAMPRGLTRWDQPLDTAKRLYSQRTQWRVEAPSPKQESAL
jgi:CRISPR system Cascade subunit CasD